MYKWRKGVHWGDISKVLQRHVLHWFSVCGSLFSFEWQVIRELGVKLREAMDHQEIMTVSVLRNLTLRNWETRGGQNAYKGRHVWTHAVCMQLESMCLNRFEAPSENKTHILSFWVIPSREGKRNDISNKTIMEWKSMCVCSIAQSCLTLCDTNELYPSASSVHGISQVIILEWVPISSSRGSSQPRDQTHIFYISCFIRLILYHWVTWKAQTKYRGKWMGKGNEQNV